MQEQNITSRNISIMDEGQIKFMSIPSGFVQQFMEPSEWHHSRYVKNFHRTDNPNVRILFYFRGNPLSEDEAGNFSRLLTTPSHILNSEEIESLELMLYEDCLPETLKLAVAKTEKINGRDVLRFEGTWIEPDLYDVGIFILANPKTHLVQEIHFLCPAKDYEQFQHYFEEALKSILWV
ncbi:MAG: hypothetical protein K2X29_13810 [Candidatus Obscuribacterales bacterium]|nr:hypothetical protein [Candidatus Obscuribacterales bacterium]